MTADEPLTPEQAAISHAWQTMFQKAAHFDDTLRVINHWLMDIHGLVITERDDEHFWWGYSTSLEHSVDIRRETYSQCLAAVLDYIAGRKEGS